MANILTISIDNKKYTVTAKANNEEHVINASNLLNSIINEFKDNFNEIDHFSPLDVMTFAALNIAEKQIINESHYDNQINIIVNELNKISEYINGLLDV